jgi:hypothetical protein
MVGKIHLVGRTSPTLTARRGHAPHHGPQSIRVVGVTGKQERRYVFPKLIADRIPLLSESKEAVNHDHFPLIELRVLHQRSELHFDLRILSTQTSHSRRERLFAMRCGSRNKRGTERLQSRRRHRADPHLRNRGTFSRSRLSRRQSQRSLICILRDLKSKTTSSRWRSRIPAQTGNSGSVVCCWEWCGPARSQRDVPPLQNGDRVRNCGRVVEQHPSPGTGAWRFAAWAPIASRGRREFS